MKIVWIGTAIGDYRQAVLNLLIERLGKDLTVLSGPATDDGSTKLGIQAPGTLREVRNHFFLGNKLYFQTGVIRPGLRARVLLMESNPRNLSNWFLLLVRKLLGRKTVLWGHAWSRSGKEASGNRLRQKMLKKADVMVAYTESQAEDLRQMLPGMKVIAAPNALYPREQIGEVLDPAGVNSFIYVGRLVASKKPALLLEGWILARTELPADWKLVFIGEGAEREGLTKRAQAAGVEDSVIFVGHESNWDRLKSFYSRALASYSPGYVGLAITQSFAFGVPMAVALDEPHAPEIEAAVDGKNALFFRSDDARALADTMLQFYRDKEAWVTRRAAIAEDCSARYSADLMADRLMEAVQ